MDGSPGSRVVDRKDTRRLAGALWLAFVAACVAVAVSTSYVADLSAFLPKAPTAEQRLLIEQLKSGVASRLLLVGLEGGTPAQRIAASQALAKDLRTAGLFEVVQNGEQSDLAEGGRLLFDHRYLLSPAVDARRFTVDGLRDGMGDTVSLLGTPAGALMKSILWRDPTGETLRMAEAMLPADAPRSEGGVWVSRSAPRAVLLLIVKADGADLDAQAAALDRLRTAFAAVPDAASLTLQVSGAPLFGVESRALIRAEVEWLALLGSAIAVLLLLVVFGSLKALLIAILPVATGVLAGIAAVGLGFGFVHGMTLGFGTTLIGEAVDYAIYYLIQTRPHPDGPGWRRWTKDTWPAVRIGLLTSLAGFCALVFSGFGGLAQLGVFSIAGLLAAALTTRHVLPLLAPDGAPGRGLRPAMGRATGWLVDRLATLRMPLAALVAAAAVALAVMPSGWRGNLSSLSTVSSEALALDAALRADLGATEAGLLVAVQGADEAEVLARSEAADLRLDALVQQGRLAGYTSPARLLPSPATQLARRAALPDDATLRAALAAAVEGGPLPLAKLDPFVADVQAQRSAEPLTTAAYEGTPLAAALHAQLAPGRDGRPWLAFLNLQLPEAAPALDGAALQAVLRDLPGVAVLQVQRELNALYAHYLTEAQWQAGVGALGVALLLAAYLRATGRLVRVLVPLAASGTVVLAGLTLAGVPLGVLHLVGLLLVIAVGSNYALFFDHLRFSGQADADTLASLLVANLTTVLSFGLLAASKVAVLAAVGEVVAPGAALALVLSAAFVGGRRDAAGTPPAAGPPRAAPPAAAP